MYSYGIAMVFLCYFYSISMYFYGIPMYVYGISLVYLWYF